jgi:small subunit ribosomal protein S4
MNIPSYVVKIGDVIQVRERSRKVQVILDAAETVVRRGIPAWLEVEKDALRGTVKAYPTREELTMPIREQLIVELYSK